MTEIKISLILPNFNGEKYLEKSILSFLDQDYANKELVIVDGKSKDASHAIIERYASTHKTEIIWIREMDSGIANAFNMGLKHVTGEIIGYLASDDFLYKNVLKEINYSKSWCDFDAIYFNSYTYFVKNNRMRLLRVPDYEITRDNLLRYGTFVGLESIFFHKRIFDEYQHDESNKYGLDYELCLRITSQKKPLFLQSQEVGVITVYDDNIGSKFAKEQREETKQVALRYSEGYEGEYFFEPRKFSWRRLISRTRTWILGLGR